LRRRLALFFAVAAALVAPARIQANGDPASDYLLTQSIFLPFNAKIDSGALKELRSVIDQANKSGFRIRVALILSPGDLGTAFSLFGKPHRYAEFLGFELSFVYRERLLVVMPDGYGFSIRGKQDPRADRVLKSLPAPGKDATKEVRAAAVAVRRLATASGHRLHATGKGSQTRDRITIAAAATAALALAAALVMWRRRRASPSY
jgi:hypothetical protein